MSSSKAKAKDKAHEEDLAFNQEVLGPLLAEASKMAKEHFEDEYSYEGDIIHISPEQEAEIYQKILASRRKKT